MRLLPTLQNAARPTQLVVAAIVACVVFAGANGFAASFGMSAGGLGADNRMIASCGAGMTLAYTTAFYTGIGGQTVNGINLSNIPADCLGKSLSVVFYGRGKSAVGSAVDATLAASGTTQSISIVPSLNTIDASQISGVSVVVSDVGGRLLQKGDLDRRNQVLIRIESVD